MSDHERTGFESHVTDDAWDAFNRQACGLHYIAHKMRDMEQRLRACLATANQVSDAWLATQPNGIREAIQNIRRNADLSPNTTPPSTDDGRLGEPKNDQMSETTT